MSEQKTPIEKAVETMDSLSIQLRELLFRLAKGSILNPNNGISELSFLLNDTQMLAGLPGYLSTNYEKEYGRTIDSIGVAVKELETRVLRLLAFVSSGDDSIISANLYRATELVETVHKYVQGIAVEEKVKEENNEEGREIPETGSDA